MNKLDKDYQALLQDILDNGVTKQDRTGTGTISVFGRQIRHKMSDGFPLLTTKKMPFKTIVTELLWFLRGDTNIKYLVDNNCHIWDGDAYKNFVDKVDDMWQKSGVGDLDDFLYDGLLVDGTDENGEWFARIPTQEEFINKIKTDDEFAKKWGELGPIYGKQWREWTHWDTQLLPLVADQIADLIDNLKTNPDSRRLMVNAWNVGELDQMVLPPCHYSFQVYTRELSHDERFELYKKVCGRELQPHITGINFKQFHFDEFNVPTRAISLMWNQRSVDTFLGLPFNIASYGLLLEMIAKEVNMVPDELIGNLGDVHLYSNHIEQAKEQIGREMTFEEKLQWVMVNTDVELENLAITEAAAVLKKRTREPFPLPKLVFNPIFLANLEHNSFDQAINGQIDFELDDYQSHPTIKAPLSN